MAQEECVAVEKLQEWLTDNERSQSWLATKCGVKPPSVHAWMTRQSRPAAHLREVIAALTSDAVQYGDWEFPSERAMRDEAIRQIRAEAEGELPGDVA